MNRCPCVCGEGKGVLIGLDGCRISEGCLTDYQTVGGSKTIDMYSLTIPEARSLRHRCQQGWAPSEGSRQPCPASGGCQRSLAWLGLYNSTLFLHLHIAFFSLYVSTFSPLLLRTPVIGLRAHPNPGQSHLKILNLITSAKNLFPNAATFTVSRC